MFVPCINIRWVPREVLKTSTWGLEFQHLPRDPANVNAREKTRSIPIVATDMRLLLPPRFL